VCAILGKSATRATRKLLPISARPPRNAGNLEAVIVRAQRYIAQPVSATCSAVVQLNATSAGSTNARAFGG
jgi:hypothetical protein